jgi:hypothetical protein
MASQYYTYQPGECFKRHQQNKTDKQSTTTHKEAEADNEALPLPLDENAKQTMTLKCSKAKK